MIFNFKYTDKSMKEVEKAIEKAGLEIVEICRKNNIDYLCLTLINGNLMFNNNYWEGQNPRIEYHKEVVTEE